MDDLNKFSTTTPDKQMGSDVLVGNLQGGYNGCSQQVALQFADSGRSSFSPSPTEIHTASMKLRMNLLNNRTGDDVTGWSGGGKQKNKRKKRIKRTKRTKRIKRTKRSRRVKQYKKTKISRITRR